MYCAKCGNQVEDGELFCSQCGSDILIEKLEPSQPGEQREEQVAETAQKESGSQNITKPPAIASSQQRGRRANAALLLSVLSLLFHLLSLFAFRFPPLLYCLILSGLGGLGAIILGAIAFKDAPRRNTAMMAVIFGVLNTVLILFHLIMLA